MNWGDKVVLTQVLINMDFDEAEVGAILTFERYYGTIYEWIGVEEAIKLIHVSEVVNLHNILNRRIL